MAPLAEIRKAHVVTLLLGVLIGVSVSYMWRFTESASKGLLSYHYLPRGLRNGSLDGSATSLIWDDALAHRHRDEDDSVAKELYKRVRVLCWVMTGPSNIKTKAKHVKATWGKRCNVLLFMSSKDDDELPAVGLKVKEGRNYLWAKTKEAFRYVYENHLNDADWFMKADDDTYVILENLRYFLHDKSPTHPVYFGRRFKPIVKQGYNSGGAGYVLSKEALTRFVEKGVDDPEMCKKTPGGAEDLEMGKCLQMLGVKIGDSRDELGRERFHPFVPENHLIPDRLPEDFWYWKYNYYPIKQGKDCCSDYAITFHYVSPNEMYVFEYMVYHLKPYGIGTVAANDILRKADKIKEDVMNKKSDVIWSSIVEATERPIRTENPQKITARTRTANLEKISPDLEEPNETDMDNMVEIMNSEEEEADTPFSFERFKSER